MKTNSGKKILVVDDEIDILHVVEILLKHNGYEVYTYWDGLNIGEIIETYNPDLILLDVQLKGVLGTDICKELKKTTDIPIVLFSAHADLEKKYHECNADAFISKPFDIHELLLKINKFIRKENNTEDMVA